jgi:hypothetical protein
MSLKTVFGLTCCLAVCGPVVTPMVSEANGQAEASSVGVRPLTATSYAAAVDSVDGTESALLLESKYRTPFLANGNAVFEVQVETPYLSAVKHAWDAKRRYQKVPPISLTALNGDLVRIKVTPGVNVSAADAIENVLFKRDGKVFQPVRKVVTPVTIQSKLGVKVTLTQGVFTFDFAVFEASTDISIVLVGRRETLEWEVARGYLEEMK